MMGRRAEKGVTIVKSRSTRSKSQRYPGSLPGILCSSYVGVGRIELQNSSGKVLGVSAIFEILEGIDDHGSSNANVMNGEGEELGQGQPAVLSFMLEKCKWLQFCVEHNVSGDLEVRTQVNACSPTQLLKLG